jgi:hypothetical protein
VLGGCAWCHGLPCGRMRTPAWRRTSGLAARVVVSTTPLDVVDRGVLWACSHTAPALLRCCVYVAGTVRLWRSDQAHSITASAASTHTITIGCGFWTFGGTQQRATRRSRVLPLTFWLGAVGRCCPASARITVVNRVDTHIPHSLARWHWLSVRAFLSQQQQAGRPAPCAQPR